MSCSLLASDFSPEMSLLHFFQEAAAVVNSTPLWECSSDPSDPLPISPSTLLCLKEGGTPLPLEEFTEEDLLTVGGRRWRRVQYLADQFWSRWRQGYLQELQRRRKWMTARRNIEPGDLVLLRDKATPRNCWATALVLDVKKSDDGLVRSATVKTVREKDSNMKSYIYSRPISEFVLLLPKRDVDVAPTP